MSTPQWNWTRPTHWLGCRTASRGPILLRYGNPHPSPVRYRLNCSDCYQTLLQDRITILLYKKGDEGEPSNWRPIALQSAIYKIYAALWAKRLASWTKEAGVISPSQKGFIAGEGCLYLMRSLMEDARRQNSTLSPLHLQIQYGKVCIGSWSAEYCR
jgi:hypothetical protein